MAGGYMGQVLWVDLTERTVVAEEPSEQLNRDFIGGYGTGVRFLYERQRPGVGPLDPENTLGFMAGPLTGTPAISASRFTVMAKSPLTRGWGDANCGGYFGPKMKFAGVDGVFVTGASDEPVYLYIEDGKAEIRDASHLWGRDSYETEAALKAAHGKEAAAATIGPSGERLSLIAAIMNDKGRAAARSGIGAVMGAKKLKAIAVKGNRKVPIADEKLMSEVRHKYLKTLGSPESTGGGLNYEIYTRWGTGGMTADFTAIGECPVRNWEGTPLDFPNADALTGDSITKYQVKRYACWHCPVACGGDVVVPDGPHACSGAKPEYETLGAFGTMCMNDNVESVCQANDICNRYGVDTISAGGIIAFAIECYENGLISRADTDGIELTWGNHQAIVQMTEKLCKREGLGDVLADGVKVAAERIGRGSDRFAIHIDGQELSMHDGRVVPGAALTYWIDPTPGRHTQNAEEWSPPFMGIPQRSPVDYADRGDDHLRGVAYQQLLNCSGLCWIGAEACDAASMLDFMTAVTGWDYTLETLMKDGERIATLRHLFNLREGLNPLDRPVPGRSIGSPPQTAGPLDGVSVDLERMRIDYYNRVGWDLETSVPSDATLERLELEELVDRYG
jgi:aldehyde:ferredoxin oxidoreductase